MTGSPKRLSDLRKIDAHLSTRCCTCGRVQVYHRELLSAYLIKRAASAIWSELPRSLPCPCGSTQINLIPMPYCRELRDPAMRPYQRQIVRLAVMVLRRAARSARDGLLIGVDISLAIQVLRPWVEVERLRAFSRHGKMNDRKARDRGVGAAIVAIERDLAMMGRLDVELGEEIAQLNG